MTVSLYIDTDRWRAHARRFVAESDAVVIPVAKGNGYGFGNATLAAEASALGATTMAVGTYDEIAHVGAFDGDILVLSPWRPWLDDVPRDPRVVHTVSRLSDLTRLAARVDQPRVVIEIMTDMRRHGVEPDGLSEVAQLLDSIRLEGLAVHLPLEGEHRAWVRRRLSGAFEALDTSSRTLWVSHLSRSAAADLGRDLGAEIRLRVGSNLWLGDRGALTARGTVLDVHPLRRGDRYGYRQRRARRPGSLVIVSGGTAHGVALEAPSAVSTARQRAVSMAKGGLEATGRALSPFWVAGRQRWFAEPPHMQCSMIWLPADVPAPAPGDELDVDVRFTIASFDRTVWT